MTDVELDNAGDISAIRCAIKGLSRDLSTITPEQRADLSDIQYELIDLMSDITGLTGKEK